MNQSASKLPIRTKQPHPIRNKINTGSAKKGNVSKNDTSKNDTSKYPRYSFSIWCKSLGAHKNAALLQILDFICPHLHGFDKYRNSDFQTGLNEQHQRM